ncbi:MAG TPA: SIMPL domain-containing protein [Pirellulales bacterium]|jgi:uncharacterized protein YggE|nr:SIMPL domain-containing protein [Pirellulales bacterium]
MNLHRFLCAAAIAVTCLATDPLLHAQNGLASEGEGSVAGTGTEVIKRTPDILRMQLEISAKAKTLGVAIKKLEAHRDAALNQLTKMASDKESTRAGEIQLNSSTSPQQQQMELMIRQRLRQAGKPVKKDGEKPITVSCTLTAEWKLKGKTAVELLLEAQAIEDNVRGADLAEGDSEEQSVEEEELAEEIEEQVMNFNDEAQQKPGEPTFIFVCKISPEDRTKATAAAFAKARRQAEELSSAAGAELGALQSVSRSLTPNNLGFGMNMNASYRVLRNQGFIQSYSVQLESGEDDAGAEALGAQPSEVILPINVTAAFQLKSTK